MGIAPGKVQVYGTFHLSILPRLMDAQSLQLRQRGQSAQVWDTSRAARAARAEEGTSRKKGNCKVRT